MIFFCLTVFGMDNVELLATNSTKPNKIVLVTFGLGIVQFVTQNVTFTILKTKRQDSKC
jgi:hypothetical protein